MDERRRRKALATLQRVYESLADRTIDTVIENEEGLEQGPFSFAYEEIDNRFAPRLINLGHMIGAIQHLGRQPPAQPQYRVECVEGPLAEIQEKINEQLTRNPTDTLHQVALAHDEDAGMWHAFLTLSRMG